MFHITMSRLFVLVFATLAHSTVGQIYLRSNGQSDTYALINSVLGGNAVEVPDCAHPSFGQHITQEFDTTLDRQVFVFHVHVKQDNDRCKNSDRQRTEIKTYNPSPSYLKGFNGETVTFSWNFRMSSDFKPSSSFTSIHQLKDAGGDFGRALITLNLRNKSSENRLELTHVDSARKSTRLRAINLNDVTGKWIHVREQITYGTNGKYSIAISNLATGEVYLSYSNSSIDMWRNGASSVRPKWGIYRSLTNADQLRDEQIKYDTFCLAKGNDTCV